MAHAAIAGFFILVIVGGVGLGVASADSSDDVARAGAFGFSNSTHAATMSLDAPRNSAGMSSQAFYERSALASTMPRDVAAGMRMVDDMERAERERIEADNVAVLKRMANEKSMQGVATSPSEAAGEPPSEGAYEYGLPAVDWSVGYDAFMAEWTARIDAYLSGSPLEGYGAVFARAAWDNGVDPRWSPAISNTESSKGSVCFRSCNAWGWGETGWDDWETAIRAHVAGLASVYGYSITLNAAQVYCPPNWSNWYNDTLSQMASI